jgi:hypothetical protein
MKTLELQARKYFPAKFLKIPINFSPPLMTFQTPSNTPKIITTMRTAIVAILSILHAPTVVAFVSTTRNELVSKIRARRTPDTDTFDIKHAKYCADHFGECSLEDMERIRSGERIE